MIYTGGVRQVLGFPFGPRISRSPNQHMSATATQMPTLVSMAGTPWMKAATTPPPSAAATMNGSTRNGATAIQSVQRIAFLTSRHDTTLARSGVSLAHG